MPRTTLRTPADIGALIRDRRLGLDLDQADLASRVGVSRLWINQIERGKPGASLGLILRTLTAVGIQLTGETVDIDSADKPADAPDIDAPDIDAPDIDAPDIDAIVAAARRPGRT